MSLGEAPDSWATVTVPPLSGCPLTALPEPIFEVVPPHAAAAAATASAVTVMVSERLMHTILLPSSPAAQVCPAVPQTHRTISRARAPFGCCQASNPGTGKANDTVWDETCHDPSRRLVSVRTRPARP